MTTLKHITGAAVPAVQHLLSRAGRADRKWLILGAVALAATAVGAAVAVRAASRNRKDAREDLPIQRAVTINKPRGELYRYWRDFSNLPSFMGVVKSIEVQDARRSSWELEGPGGKRVRYEAVIIEDEPERAIAWESAGGDVQTRSRVEFRDAPGGRGTEVHAQMDYQPPLGVLGKLAALATQKAPEVQSLRDLRRFKQLMETGEISTTEGAGAAPAARKIKQ